MEPHTSDLAVSLHEWFQVLIMNKPILETPDSNETLDKTEKTD